MDTIIENINDYVLGDCSAEQCGFSDSEVNEIYATFASESGEKVLEKDMDFYYALQNEAIEKGWEFYQSAEGGDIHLVTETNHYINEQIDVFLTHYPELQNLYRHMIEK